MEYYIIMRPSLITNKEILVAINDVKAQLAQRGGSNPSITKKDVMDTLFLLLYFKAKHAADAAALPVVPKPPVVADTCHYKSVACKNGITTPTNITHERLKSAIDDILEHLNKKIDGSNTTVQSSIKNTLFMKQNLARILYFIALDACDALTTKNVGKYSKLSEDLKRFNFENHDANGEKYTVSYSSYIKQKFSEYNNGYIELFKKLFFIASTVADNKIKVENSKLEDSPVVKPEMYFFDVGPGTAKGIVNTDTLIIGPENVEIKNTFIKIVKNDQPISGDHHTTTIKFNTSVPEIMGESDVTVNLRVIQTILMGRNVTTYSDLAPPDKTYITQIEGIVNPLLTAFGIDVSITSSP